MARGKFNEALFRTAQIVRRRTRVRAETISKLTRLKFDTVIQNLGALETAGLVERLPATGDEEARGAPPPARSAIWRLRPDLGYNVGACVERDRVVATAFDFGLDAAGEKVVRGAPGALEDPDGTVVAVVEAVLEVLDTAPNRPLFGIGVALPMPVERAPMRTPPDESNDGRAATKLAMRWQGRFIGREIQAALSEAGLPARVSVDNDASLGALGQFLRKLTASAPDGPVDPDLVPRDIAYVRVAGGVGMGLVLKGKHVRGGRGLAGEIGHVRVDGARECPRCHKPCLETVASVDAIRTALTNPSGSVPSMAEVAGMLTDRSRRVPDAPGIVWRAGAELGRALGNVAILIDPRLIVVGGPIARYPEIANVYGAGLRHAFEEYGTPLSDTEIRALRPRVELQHPAAEIPWSELRGAAALALRHPATDDWLAEQCVGLTARIRTSAP